MGAEFACKGAWALGTACGECARCRETALEGAKTLQTVVRDLRAQELGRDEIDALWNWHHERELHHARRGEYDDAKSHSQRAAVFWRAPRARTPV